MKKNLKMVAFALVVSAVAVLNVMVVLNSEHVEDMAMTSLAAIGEGASGESGESGHPCPSPYDVYGYGLSFPQYEGSFTVSIEGEIEIMGKKFRVAGARGNLSITCTYHMGGCNIDSPSSCCDHNKIGQVINVVKKNT